MALQTNTFTTYENAAQEINALDQQLKSFSDHLKEMPLIILTDDASFAAATLNNFLWIAFTRCNPSHDIHGIDAFVKNKHWGCNGPLIIDARIKPHHAPPLIKDAVVEDKIDHLFNKGGSLYPWR